MQEPASSCTNSPERRKIMAEFCKIRSDGSVMAAPNPLRIVVSNPSDERYRYEGWLEKRYTEPPEYSPDTQYITDHWVQDGQYAV